MSSLGSSKTSTSIEHEIGCHNWLAAIKIARFDLPELVPSILASAGTELWARGMHIEAYSLLSDLPADIGENESVLGLQVVVALSNGMAHKVVKDMASFLEKHNSPNLRALYAEILFQCGRYDEYLCQSLLAFQQSETPLTLYTYGRSVGLSSTQDGVCWLEQALCTAERSGDYYIAPLIASGLAARYNSLGKHMNALYWTEWGLKLYEQQQMSQMHIYHDLINEHAYASLFCDKHTHPSTKYNNALNTDTSDLSPTLLISTTQADHALIQGHISKALKIYHKIWEECQDRNRLGAVANLYVRALIEQNLFDEALAISAQAVELTKDLHVTSRRRAILALGMAQSVTSQKEAVETLENAVQLLAVPLLAPRLAQAKLYLVRAYREKRERERATEVMSSLQSYIKNISNGGLSYLVDSTSFHFTKQLPSTQLLELNFCGEAKVNFQGKEIPLRRRFCDILAVLAAYPKGLSAEQLTLLVYGETTDTSLCRVELGRLRKYIPICSRPYRLGVPFKADFIEIEALLISGKIKQALSIYKGLLLPFSNSPEVRSIRELSADNLRLSVLRTGDPELLWDFALRAENKSDLELWEGLLKSFCIGDARQAIATARIEHIIKEW